MGVFFGLLIGLELKHYIADYFMQPGWMIRGKGNLLMPGGYAHAGLHAALSLAVLLLFGSPPALALALFAAEFALHYALDYAKVAYSRGADPDRQPMRYWALHGTDQLAHQLTYAAMIYVVLRGSGLA